MSRNSPGDIQISNYGMWEFETYVFLLSEVEARVLVRFSFKNRIRISISNRFQEEVVKVDVPVCSSTPPVLLTRYVPSPEVSGRTLSLGTRTRVSALP